MNNFILNYKGNKYLECKKFFNDFDFTKYDIIVEPFCGIFGFSRYAYEKGFKGEFYLNDLSTDLINVLNELKEDDSKFINNIENELSKYKIDKDLSYDKNKTYALSRICQSRSERLCSIDKGYTKIKNYKNKKTQYDDFFKKVELFNMKSTKFIEQLPKDKKILIFYDPPYFNSSNTTYSLYLEKDADGYADVTTLYLNIYENFNNINHDQILIINHIEILHKIFKKYFVSSISGKYQNSKKNLKKHNLYLKNKKI